MPNATKTFRAARKPKKIKKAKNKNARQDQRLAHLEKLVLPAIEYKSNDVTAQNAPVSDTGYVNQPMAQIAEGTGPDERIGDKISIMSHNVSMKLTSSDNTNVVRVLWVYTEGTDTLALSDVLEYSSTAEYALISPYKKRSTNNAIKYKVMFDKVYKFDTSTACMIDKYQLKPAGRYGKKIEFNSASRVQPEQYKLHVMAVSDSGSASHPQISYVCRTRYIDL